MSVSKNPKKRTLSTVLLLFAVLFVALVFMYQRSARAPLKRVDTSLVLPNSEYVIDPIQYDPNVREEERVFPYVRVQPNNPLYTLIRRDEENMIRKGILPPSFYASKRISEIERWKNEYKVEKSYSDLNHLRSIARRAPNLLKLKENKMFLTWENMFARYYDLYLRELHDVERDTDEHQLVARISKLQRQLNLDQTRLYGVIINSGLGKDDQRYLKSVSDAVFSDLESRLTELGPKTSNTALLYPLADILKYRDYGLYDIIIDTANLPSQMQFSLDGVDIETATYDFIHQRQNRAGALLTIPITDSAHALQLQLDTEPLAQESDWVYEKTSKTAHRYTIPLATPAAELVYSVKARYKTRVPVNFQLTRTEPGKSSTLVDENFYPHSYYKQFERRFILRNRTDAGMYKLVINSSEQLSDEDFAGISVSISRLLLPQIIFNKTDYLAGREPVVSYEKVNNYTYRITVHDGTHVVDEYVKQSLGTTWGITRKEAGEGNQYVLIVENTLRILLLKLISILSILFLLTVSLLLIWIHNDHAAVVRVTWYLYRHYFALSRMGRKTASTYWRICRTIMKRMIRVGSVLAYPLITLLLILLTGSFSFLQGYPEHTIILAGVTWLLISIGFLVNRRTPFALMLLCFVVSAGAYVSTNRPAAITAAGLGIMFLLCGLIYTYAYAWIVALHTGIKRPGSEYLERAITYLIQSLGSIYRIMRKSADIYANKFLIQNPVQKRHHVWNISVICTTAAAFLYLCYLAGSTGTTIYHAYKDAQHRRLRASLNPAITKVEPSIVYHSTKVVIYGSGFGWQQEGTRALKKDGEIVNVDLWTDTKIILTVPLHWKTGSITLWTEKPLLWEGNMVTAKSNAMKIKLIPTTNTFTPDDDAYFQQLKTLSPETLKLNGYQQ